MQLNRHPQSSSPSKNAFLFLACVFLLVSVSLSGCSKQDSKEGVTEEKPVVTEMNIQTEPESVKVDEPVKDEVESLPMEADDEEELLPVLGAGG